MNVLFLFSPSRSAFSARLRCSRMVSSFSRCSSSGGSCSRGDLGGALALCSRSERTRMKSSENDLKLRHGSVSRADVRSITQVMAGRGGLPVVAVLQHLHTHVLLRRVSEPEKQESIKRQPSENQKTTTVLMLFPLRSLNHHSSCCRFLSLSFSAALF